MNKIEVSIIMGVYNCEDTIDEAIQSILEQTFTNWEFIICDDCSTDNTYQKVQKYVDKYPDKKSCTPPANIVPSTIHKNAAGPNKAP